MSKKELLLKINHILFWWYYKRVPEHFHSWTLLKSITILKDNYEHSEFRNKQAQEVINSAIKTEEQMTREISNLTLRLKGVPQKMIDPLNEAFGTNLKGLSNEEINN